eukprot:CAMPEP_0204365514 /NCGR_PEP_ID=MMETSP0469-20131031/41956_1 /ASSEMBLY_ACC=CAM_ASM_000384 /TAXON_ID=2969 /ORGANISM="Oxyrrhis marina" /LENGTH=381 /DNA_ID=CAMNT_0051354579 /DNA_START=43 /DNA_END=1188 /DNA_ORIENTATION=-
MDAFLNEGNACFVGEDYDRAVVHYTTALEKEPTAKLYENRAAAYLKLGEFQKVVEDIDAALAYPKVSPIAHRRRGMGLFYLGEFAAAKKSFEAEISMCESAAATTWVRKCEAELSGSTLPLRGLAFGERVAKSARTEDTRPPAQAAPAATEAPKPAAAPAPVPEPAAEANRAISGRPKIRHEWYQSTSHVMITIFAKKCTKDDVNVEFEDRQVGVNIKLPGSDGEEYQQEWSLAFPVDPAGCSCEVTPVKVELKLKKLEADNHWKSLEPKDLPIAAEVPAAYPTSRPQKKDWASIDKEIDAELKAEKPEGEEALNTLFRQIYSNASEDTRRAMVKSFQTSGGTVLSTNWDEVARADYEGKDRPSAPEGQVWIDPKTGKSKQ